MACTVCAAIWLADERTSCDTFGCTGSPIPYVKAEYEKRWTLDRKPITDSEHIESAKRQESGKYHLGNYDPHIVPDAYSTKGLKK